MIGGGVYYVAGEYGINLNPFEGLLGITGDDDTSDVFIENVDEPDAEFVHP